MTKAELLSHIADLPDTAEFIVNFSGADAQYVLNAQETVAFKLSSRVQHIHTYEDGGQCHVMIDARAPVRW